jgi:hypothetical protein
MAPSSSCRRDGKLCHLALPRGPRHRRGARSSMVGLPEGRLMVTPGNKPTSMRS